VFILYRGLEKGQGGGNNKGNDGFLTQNIQECLKTMKDLIFGCFKGKI
jgi:hypothetical protein